MTGYQSKKAAAQDKLVVTDIDGHVVRDARKPKKVALDRDAEIERLNEKIEFLARTNMLYSDWEHRNTQVTSDLMRKGIEEAKINADLRAEIAELKAQLAQPAQEPVAWMYDWFCDGKLITGWIAHSEPEIPRSMALNIRPLYTAPPQRTWVGLTYDERYDCVHSGAEDSWDVALLIEAKLKEKNT